MDRLTTLAVGARHDPSSAEEFLRTVQAEVWRLCSALVGPDHADDVAQDSLIRILRALPEFRAESSARTWALRITRYTCADWILRQQRQRRLVNKIIDLRPSVGESSESGRIELNALIQALVEEQRDAFVLTQVLGLSYAEAADVCGCEVGTIRSRVYRARERITSMLAADEPDRRSGSYE